MIWLIGDKGMLGTELSMLLEKAGLPFVGTDLELDITDLPALENFAEKQSISHQKIQWIVNCAAYTAVDKAEDDKEICRLLDTDGPRNLC